MHEQSTFAYQLAEYKAMPKLTKLMHRTLFWSDIRKEIRAELLDAIETAEETIFIERKKHCLYKAEGLRLKLSFCTARLKAAKFDLKNLLIEIEQINKIIA